MYHEESSPQEESPFQAFTDAITALLFIFMLTTLWVMHELRVAQQKSVDELARLQGADVAAGVLLDDVALCLNGADVRDGEIKAVLDPAYRTLSLYIELNHTVAELFAGCSSEIAPIAYDVLSHVRTCLANEVPALVPHYSVTLSLEGHTDGRSTAGACALTYPSNWELSGARAGAVLRRLLCDDGSCVDAAARDAAARLRDLASRREDVQFVAAGSGSSIPAWRALCDPNWPGAAVDTNLDREVCGAMDGVATDPAGARIRASAAIEASASARGDSAGRTFDEALVYWANDPACIGAENTLTAACRQRLGRLRRVDLHIELRPKVIDALPSPGSATNPGAN